MYYVSEDMLILVPKIFFLVRWHAESFCLGISKYIQVAINYIIYVRPYNGSNQVLRYMNSLIIFIGCTLERIRLTLNPMPSKRKKTRIKFSEILYRDFTNEEMDVIKSSGELVDKVYRKKISVRENFYADLTREEMDYIRQCNRYPESGLRRYSSMSSFLDKNRNYAKSEYGTPKKRGILGVLSLLRRSESNVMN